MIKKKEEPKKTTKKVEVLPEEETLEEVEKISEDKVEAIPEEIESFKKEDEHQAKKAKEAEAILNIYTSFNNTIAHVTDMAGRTITKITGGMVTKQDRLKANPTVAMFISKRVLENIKDTPIKSLYVRIRAKTNSPAPGPGAHAIVKSLIKAGIKIVNISDTTRIPRGGPKKKGGRRGRRV